MMQFSGVLMVANGLIWGQSIAELVFVVRYDLWSVLSPPYLLLVRDVCYQSFSVLFLLFGTLAHGRLWRLVHYHPVLEQMEIELRDHITQQIDDATKAGEYPPPLRPIFRAIYQHDAGSTGFCPPTAPRA